MRLKTIVLILASFAILFFSACFIILQYFNMNSSSTNDEKETSSASLPERIKKARREHPDIPLDIFQIIKELENENDSIKRKRYVFRFLKPDFEPNNDNIIRGYPYPYEILQENMESGSDIDELIAEMESFMLSEMNLELNNIKGDPYKQLLTDYRKYLRDNYQEMMKVPKFVNYNDNQFIVDFSANNRDTEFRYEDLNVLVFLSIYKYNWSFDRHFEIPRMNKQLHIKYMIVKAEKADISKISILQVRLRNVLFQSSTPRGDIKKLNKMNIGIKEVLDIRLAKEEANGTEITFYCVALMHNFKKLNYKIPLKVNENIEVTMLLSRV